MAELKRQTRKSSAPARERILEASRMMFNANGVERAAVMKIATAIGMSPGNLTYHFNTKTDIVRELALRLETGLHDNLFRMQAPFSARHVVETLTELFKILWYYRFLFNSGPFFHISDPESSNIYQKIHDDLRAIMDDYLTQVVESGYVGKPYGPHGVRLFSDNIISVWLQWLLDQNMRTPLDDVPARSAIRDVIARHIAVMSPYLSQAYSDALRDDADRLLGPYEPRPLPAPSVPMQWRQEKNG